ncbi:MAG: GSCFA domain-containing protein [Chitinophagia bacterium]|jgi:hypothetical protein
MKFHLTTEIPYLPNPITHADPILLVGSCFTENMGNYLRKYKFSVLDNPSGIMFNPVSVVNSLHRILQNKPVSETDLFYYLDCYHSWEYHSSFSDPSAAYCVKKINSATQVAHDFLSTSRVLIITLGSAWVCQLTDAAPGYQPEKVVANNHKGPSNWFEKKLFDSLAIIQLFSMLIDRLHAFNPALQIIFTVSPVRHLREGLVNNNRSKAILIQAVHALAEKYQQVYYFPAYELVIDELRDYRFYAEDLVHPNYQATRYVWDKFVEYCLSENAKNLLPDLHDILLAFQHRPLHPGTVQHQKFLQQYAEKTRSLQAQFPFLNLEAELLYFQTGSH